jgi:hypothetical protein
MTAVRNHWISQCYLRSFSVKKRRGWQLAVYDAVERKTFPAGTHNVALQRGFNLVDVEGLQADAFETTLANFESEAAPAIQRIIAARSLGNVDDRATLLNLIALFALRNPRQREIFRDFQERVAKTIMSLALSTRERWEGQVRQARAAGYIKEGLDASYDTMKDFFERGEYKVEVATERHIQLELSTFDKLLPPMFGRKWLLLRASKTSGGFITSDHPVCLIWSQPGPRGPIGFGLKDTEVIFPLSPNLAVIGSFEEEDAALDAPDDTVAAINGIVIGFAERQVYARDGNFKYKLRADDVPRKASKLMSDPAFLRRHSRRAA